MATTVEMTTRPNRYSGACVLCGEDVTAGSGRLGRRGSRWVVAHQGICPEPIDYRPTYGPPRWVPLAERVEAALQRPGADYVARYQGIVEHAATYEQALERISQSAQGMTMDYMTEFSRESHAIALAREAAADRFGMPFTPTRRS